MKILKQEKSGNQLKLEVEVALALFEEARQREIAEAAQEVKIPGFRPGRAPADLVENYLDKEAVETRAAGALLLKIYPDLISELKIEPIDYPVLNSFDEKSENSTLVLGISVEVNPEVILGKYKGLKVDKLDENVSENEVEQALESLRDQFAEFKDIVDREARAEDIAEINLKAFAEDKELFTLSRSGLGIILGKNQWIPGFDEQLLGLKSGDLKEFNLTLPQDFADKNIAGKEVAFKIELKRLVEKKLPPLNDEFAKTAAKLETLEKLREETRKNLAEQKKENADADLKNKIVELAALESQVDPPRVLLNREIEMMLDELSQSLAHSNLTLEDYLRAIKKDKEVLKSELTEVAAKRVKSKLVLKSIAKVENLEIIDADINQEINQLAAAVGKSPQDFGLGLGESGREYIREYLLRRKALDFLVSKSKIK